MEQLFFCVNSEFIPSKHEHPSISEVKLVVDSKMETDSIPEKIPAKTTRPLHHLKDAELEAQLQELVGRERQLLHVILKHIQEVDRRKLFAARAFSSLFDYLTKFMGYSNAAAQRRIEAARWMNQVPELAVKIQKGQVNLSQIGVLTQAVKIKESQMGKKLSSEMKQEIISDISQKTTAQTQVLVAQKLDLPLQEPERKKMQKDLSCILSITLTEQQQIKLQRCRELLAAKLQQQNKAFTTINFLEELMDFYLNKKDPTHTPTEKKKNTYKETKNLLDHSTYFTSPVQGAHRILKEVLTHDHIGEDTNHGTKNRVKANFTSEAADNYPHLFIWRTVHMQL